MREIADNVCVMQLGQMVEQVTVDEIFENAKSDYTRNLLAAIPGAD
ncbi:hypothetical protein [Glutamicibacter sp. BW80]